MWAFHVVRRVRDAGWWADFTDPASGYPVRHCHNICLRRQVVGSQGSSFYPDVHGSQTLLKYDLVQVGGCAMLRHPRYGTRVYPATLFIRAPESVILQALNALDAFKLE